MKKCAIWSAAFFMVMLGVAANVNAANIWGSIDMSKNVSGSDTSYGVTVAMGGADFPNVKMVTLSFPNGSKQSLYNSVGLSSFNLGGGPMDFNTFSQKFPEGVYKVTLFPKKYGGGDVTVAYDFPATPVITYPKNAAINVPLTFTGTWEEMSGIDEVRVRINNQDGNQILYTSLPPDSTSLKIPAGVLEPSTTYQLYLIAFKQVSINAKTVSVISFTTAAQ